MPNRDTHIAIGILVAIVFILLLSERFRRENRSQAELLGVGLGVLATCRLPDILEPASWPGHRQSFHSLAALGGSVLLYDRPPESIRRWRESLRAGERAFRARRQDLPRNHPDRAGLWCLEMGCGVLAGMTAGLPLGYASHLGADLTSPGGLPLL